MAVDANSRQVAVDTNSRHRADVRTSGDNCVMLAAEIKEIKETKEATEAPRGPQHIATKSLEWSLETDPEHIRLPHQNEMARVSTTTRAAPI